MDNPNLNTETRSRLIYVAEDNEIYHILLRDNLELMLRKDGVDNIKLEFFYNGESLKEKIEQGDSDLRVVLTDNIMPKVTGLSIIEELARNPRYENIKFILHASGGEYLKEDAINKGAFDCVLKPSEFEDLVNVIKEALDGK